MNLMSLADIIKRISPLERRVKIMPTTGNTDLLEVLGLEWWYATDGLACLAESSAQEAHISVSTGQPELQHGIRLTLVDSANGYLYYDCDSIGIVCLCSHYVIAAFNDIPKEIHLRKEKAV